MLIVRVFRHDALGFAFPADAAPAPWATLIGEVELSDQEYEALMDQASRTALEVAARN